MAHSEENEAEFCPFEAKSREGERKIVLIKTTKGLDIFHCDTKCAENSKDQILLQVVAGIIFYDIYITVEVVKC